MLYKDFGRTGKKVSAIGFGGMRFPKSDKGYDYDYCAEMIHEANRLGINYFDTAPFYNDDKIGHYPAIWYEGAYQEEFNSYYKYCFGHYYLYYHYYQDRQRH